MKEGIYLQAVPNVVLLAITLLFCLGGELSKVFFSHRNPDDMVARQIFIALSSLVSGIVLLCWGGFGQVSVFTVVLGIVFGLATALQATFHLKALEIGPWAYTVVLVSLSSLLTALSGTIFWDESLTFPQIIGMVFMVLCLILSVMTGGEEKKATLRWFLFCMLAFLCSGSVGIMQKWHQSTPHRAELNGFLIIAFAVGFLYAVCSIPFMRRKEPEKPLPRAKNVVLYSILYGLMFAVVNKLNLYLAGVMDSAVFFPVVNGGGLMLTTLTAIVVFRERLTRRQWIGMACGILSVLLVCDPFTK